MSDGPCENVHCKMDRERNLRLEAENERLRRVIAILMEPYTAEKLSGFREYYEQAEQKIKCA